MTPSLPNHAHDVRVLAQQALARVRADEPGSADHERPLECCLRSAASSHVWARLPGRRADIPVGAAG